MGGEQMVSELGLDYDLLSGPSYVWAMVHMWSQQEASNTAEIKGVPNSNICNA